MVDIICDNKKLIYSNRICCISNESISLKIDLANKDFLNIIFNFSYESGGVKTSMRSPENGKIVFELNDYTNSLGTGLTKPVEIGQFNNKKIFIIFYVYRLDEKAFPILDLSLYMEV